MANENEIEMSKARSKQMAVSAGKIALHTVTTLSLGPIGAGCVELLRREFFKVRDDRNKARLQLLTETLLEGQDKEVGSKLLLVELEVEDVFDVIHNMIDDEETEKAEYYAKLLKYIARKGPELSRKRKVALTKQFRNLDVIDFSILKEICEMPTDVIKEDSILMGEFKKKCKADIYSMLSMKKLISMGLVEDDFLISHQSLGPSNDYNTYREILCNLGDDITFDEGVLIPLSVEDHPNV